MTFGLVPMSGIPDPSGEQSSKDVSPGKEEGRGVQADSGMSSGMYGLNGRSIFSSSGYKSKNSFGAQWLFASF